MTLSRSLATAVFGPVHAGGDELDRGGIDHVDGATETPGDSLAPVAASKTWDKGLQMTEHLPEKFFGKKGRAFLVGVGKIIAAGRGRSPAASPAARGAAATHRTHH